MKSVISAALGETQACLSAAPGEMQACLSAAPGEMQACLSAHPVKCRRALARCRHRHHRQRKRAAGNRRSETRYGCRRQRLKMIRDFIPRHVGNDTVLGTLDAMRRGEKNMHRLFGSNYANNRFAIRNHRESIRRAHGLVEDQKNYTDMKFGRVTMAYAGCEVFAAGNALRTLTGRQVNYPKLIERFERDGMILLGGFGTAPKAIAEFFEECGYETELVTHPELFDSVAAVNDVSILTLYNDGEDIMQKVHTVCVTREKDGYYAHNVYCDGTVVGPCKTIEQMLSNINGGRSKGISLIGIS